MNNTRIYSLKNFNDDIRVTAKDAIFLYNTRNDINTNYDEIDIHLVLTEWIDNVYIQIFRDHYTQTTFDRKVEMLFGWHETAEVEQINIFFDIEYYYFEYILDNMFENNVVLK